MWSCRNLVLKRGMTKNAKSPAHVRTRDEVVAETGEQLQALRELMIKFESGEQWAGKLLATIIYMLCHDGWAKSKSRSLIIQLGYRTWFTCITTANEIIPNAFVQSPPTLAFGGTGWIPRCAIQSRDHFTKIPFEEWWAQPVFVHEGHTLTRKELILELRFKDGAGHFDSALESEQYMLLKQGGGWEHFSDDFGKLPAQPIHLLITYTVAWELYNSFVEVSGKPQVQSSTQPV